MRWGKPKKAYTYHTVIWDVEDASDVERAIEEIKQAWSKGFHTTQVNAVGGIGIHHFKSHEKVVY